MPPAGYEGSGTASGVVRSGRAVHRYLLPVAGAAGVGLGAVWQFGAAASSPEASAAVMLSVGACAVAAALEIEWIERRRRDRTARPLSGPTTPRPTGIPQRRPGEAPLSTADALAARPSGAGISRGVASTIATGDQLWTELTGPAPGSLPVELVGPISSAAYLPVAPDLAAGLPYGEPIVVSTEEAPYGPPDWPFSGTPLTPAPSFEYGTYVADLGFTPGTIEFEAANAFPPHLRKEASHHREGAAADEFTPGSPWISSCATCTGALAEEAGWRRCLACRRPLCHECVVEAFVTQGRPWCTGCALHDSEPPAAADN